MGRPFRCEDAREEHKLLNLKQPELPVAVLLEERLQCLAGKVSGPADGDVRVIWLHVRFETCTQDGVLHMMMQGKEMRMPFTHPHPYDGNVPTRAEEADALQRQEERRDVNVPQALFQLHDVIQRHLAEEAQSEVLL